MIELRWTWKQQANGIVATNATVGTGNLPMLQYRYRAPAITDSLRAYPPEDWTWSEWIDVPLPEKP